jgi:hypothetical protein
MENLSKNNCVDAPRRREDTMMGWGLISLWLCKEKIIYGIEKTYLLYIFHPELHSLMTWLL